MAIIEQASEAFVFCSSSPQKTMSKSKLRNEIFRREPFRSEVEEEGVCVCVTASKTFQKHGFESAKT